MLIKVYLEKLLLYAVSTFLRARPHARTHVLRVYCFDLAAFFRLPVW